jgi:hypothetical protein
MVTTAFPSRLRLTFEELHQLMPLTWALMNQGSTLSYPDRAFQAATVLSDETDRV